MATPPTSSTHACALLCSWYCEHLCRPGNPAATYILTFAGNCAVRTIVESIDGCGASATSRWRNCLRCVRDSNAHMSQDSRQRRLQPESTYGDTCSPTSVGTDPQRAVATTYADIAESSSKVTQSRHDQTTSSPEQMPDSGIAVDLQSLMAVLHPEHARVILCKKIRSPRRSSNLSYSNLCSARLSNTRSAWKPILTTVAAYAQTAASPSSMRILCYWPNKEIKWNDSWARQLIRIGCNARLRDMLLILARLGATSCLGAGAMKGLRAREVMLICAHDACPARCQKTCEPMLS